MHRVFINLALVTLLSFATAFSGAAATRGASAAAPAAKAPEVLPAGGLQDASSVYLRQAASQQVRWQPYRAETFAMAKRMNRPILIDIGAMWCHWCHVMDEQTYADPQVAALINQSFVPIKVDRDQRPDIDQYYQAAAAELSGNGGWPLTCFTMPDGALFAAFGFLPPTAAAPNHDSGMEAVLKQVVEDYKTRHKEVAAQAAALNDKLKKSPVSKVVTEDKPAIIELLAGMGNAYDHTNGGFSFGEGPKFYEFPGLEFAMTAGFYGHREFAAMALESLRKMAHGGVYDQLGGGFHRYSTDQAWQVPHFEKMSYDQALALSAYAHAFQISGDPQFKQVALSVAGYVENTLLNPTNAAFYASQDADAFPGDDGAFYTWSKAQIADALKGNEYKAAVLYFGLDDHPPTAPDGRLLLRPAIGAEQVGAQLKMPVDRAQKLIDQALAKLRAARSRRRVPAVDPAVLIDRNALMDSGLIDAGQAFGDPRFERMALDNLDYLYAQARMPDGSYCHVAGKAGSCVHGLAADQVYMLNALLAAYQVSGQSRELKRAEEIAQIILKDFCDSQSGAIRNAGRADEQETAAGRWLDGVESYFDGEVPSVQGVAARDFAILDALAPDHGYDQKSTALLAHAPVSVGAALMLATVGRAIAERMHGYALLVVDGSPGDAATLPLLNAAQSAYRPGKVLAWIDPQSNPGIGPLAAAQLLAPDPDLHDAFAFVCAGNVCTARVTTPKELTALIDSFGLPKAENEPLP
ncbi:MAG TPA: thioredoxin domain-containing protein [Candidatus Binataceae bacterium]|nr:thioredoxin domain-containing protein [Candidatus Binataceae bacterium]